MVSATHRRRRRRTVLQDLRRHATVTVPRALRHAALLRPTRMCPRPAELRALEADRPSTAAGHAALVEHTFARRVIRGGLVPGRRLAETTLRPGVIIRLGATTRRGAETILLGVTIRRQGGSTRLAERITGGTLVRGHQCVIMQTPDMIGLRHVQ